MSIYDPIKQIKHFSGFKPEYSSKSENLSGVSILMAYKKYSNETGYSCVVSKGYNSNGRYGYSLEIVNLLQDILNFSINYMAHDNINPDSFTPEGENADVVICHPSLDHIPDNAQLLLPTLHSRLVIVYQTAGLPLEKDLFIRNTAGGHMWMYLFAVSLLLAVCFRLSTHLHHRIQPRHNDWSWLEVVQWTFGAVCQQGSAKQPQGCSCRTMFVIGYIITNMIFTGFAAGITSLLAIRSEPATLKWHQAVRMNSPFTVVCNSGADRYLRNLMIEVPSERMFKCVATIEELLWEVNHLGSAGVLSETSLTYHYAILQPRGNEDINCQLAVARQTHHNHFSGFVVKRHSPFIGPFNYWLLRFKEHGLLQRMTKLAISRLPDCQQPPGYTQVSFQHVKSPFLIISANFILSLIILCCEILIDKYNVLLKRQNINKKILRKRLASMYDKRSKKFRK